MVVTEPGSSRRGASLTPALLLAGLLALTSGCADAGAALPAAVGERQTDTREPSARARSAEDLVRRLGCAVCHADLPGPRAPLALALDRTELSADSIFNRLRARPVRDDTARMPFFHLDEREAASLALYLGRGRAGAALRRIAGNASESLRAAGGRIYAALNCAGCHAHAAHTPYAAGPALTFEGSRVTPAWLREYLRRPRALRPFGARPGSGARMPDFALSAAEADSLGAFLERRTTSLPVFRPTPLSRHARSVLDTLLSRRWSCLGCHRWQARGGRVGPDLTRAGARLQPDYVRAILQDPQHVAPGTAMPPAPLVGARLDALASLLVGGDSTGAQAVSIDSARAGYLSLLDHVPIVAANPEPAATYNHRCAPCHGMAGNGAGFNAAFLRVSPANHTDSLLFAQRADDRVYDAIAAGGYVLGRSPEMPAFPDLPPERVRALVQYIRALCHCAQPAWARTEAAR